MSCVTKQLTADILKSCEFNPIANLESDIVIILRDDVDWTATTFDTNNPLLCTHLALKIEKKGFKVEGFKAQNKAFHEMKENDFGIFYEHKLSGILSNMTPANRQQVYNLVNGDRYIAVIEKQWKGANNEGAFLILGKENGLVGSVHTYDSSGNNGVELFEMKTRDGEMESLPPLNLVDTNYDTTKTAFGNKFES